MKTKIIDSHMHIPQWRRSDGASAFRVIDEYCGNTDIAYVDNMCCSNNADLWDGYEMDQSILGAVAKLENPHVFTHGCLYIPKDVNLTKQYDFVSQLDELMELGMDGIKICDFKPDAYKLLRVGSRLDEYERFITQCETYGVPMCWHVADPDFFWDESRVSDAVRNAGWFYGDDSYPSYNMLIDYALDMIRRHPKLHVTLAHAFFKSEKPEEIEKLLKENPNVTIDLAPGGEMFDGFRLHYDEWYRIFRTFSDRFLFATDASTASSAEWTAGLAQRVLRFLRTDDVFAFSDANTAHGICLEPQYLENILYKNHDRIVGSTPRQINKAALKKYIDRYLPLMPDSLNKRLTEEYRRKNLL